MVSGRFFLLGLALWGCAAGPHVKLEAPPPSAPAQERIQAFQKLRPVTGTETATVYTGQYGGTYVGSRDSFLILADGRRIEHASDLLPVVAADSPTALAIARHRRAASRASKARRLKWGAIAVGVTAVVVALPNTDNDWGTPTFVSGAVVAALGAGIGWIVESRYEHRADDEQVAAFVTYESSLMGALALCVNELEILPCEVAPRRRLQRIERLGKGE